MKTKDLIKQLQDMVDAHEKSGAAEMLGEHEIMLDVFKEAEGPGHFFQYAGFSDVITFGKSADGVYDIINGFTRYLQ